MSILNKKIKYFQFESNQWLYIGHTKADRGFHLERFDPSWHRNGRYPHHPCSLQIPKHLIVSKA